MKIEEADSLARIANLIIELGVLAHREHYSSCPLSTKPNERCSCGADKHNKKVDDLIKGWLHV